MLESMLCKIAQQIAKAIKIKNKNIAIISTTRPSPPKRRVDRATPNSPNDAMAV